MALRICIFNIFLKLGQVILLWKHFFFLFSCKYLTGTLRKKKSNFFPSIICKLKAQTKELNQRGVCCESFDSLCKHWCVVGWVMRLPLHFWASPLAQGVSAMEGLTLPVLSGCFCCCGCCPGNSSREEENNFGFFSVQFQWWNHFLTRRFIWEGDVLGMLESFLVAG